eukprot:6182746-Prymnesium_polylepis.1
MHDLPRPPARTLMNALLLKDSRGQSEDDMVGGATGPPRAPHARRRSPTASGVTRDHWRAAKPKESRWIAQNGVPWCAAAAACT